ncbi:MAG: hypothetical protein HY329_27760 [Chloroflexi bacterium]|nr:hypothetical protein [Chloroflexota bacterium]
MEIGILWYDADPKKDSLMKIEEAAARFRERTGRRANACEVAAGEQIRHPKLRVSENPRLKPHFYFVGVATAPAARQAG